MVHDVWRLASIEVHDNAASKRDPDVVPDHKIDRGFWRRVQGLEAQERVHAVILDMTGIKLAELRQAAFPRACQMNDSR